MRKIFWVIAAYGIACMPLRTEKYGLRDDRVVVESGSDQGTDSEWWLNSGAYFSIKDKVGKTVWGELSENDPWRELYSRGINFELTDGGRFPQNIFRLVSKRVLRNYTQEGYYWIEKVNSVRTPDRDGSDGILHFVRYADGDHLYYCGIRVDGIANCKKKNGTYTTLAFVRIFAGDYDNALRPNLLPEKKWIGMRTSVATVSDGSVSLKMFIDTDAVGNWKLVLEAMDNGTVNGPIFQDGRFGIRSDYMDLQMHGIAIRDLDHRGGRKR